jgi:GNAT superfamily N-acetyltransferase
MTLIRRVETTDIKTLSVFDKEEGYFERCLEEQSQGKRDVLMAFREGRAAGYAMLSWQPQYPLYRKLQIPEIQDLNVITAFRRQGIATTLIEECEKRAKAKSCDHIGISVGLFANYGPAQRLYVKRGYVPDGYGVTYDRVTVTPGEIRPVDDNLCLMMIKDL